jgi:hypothetical protein
VRNKASLKRTYSQVITLNPVHKNIFFLIPLLAIFACCLCISCGKKGDPTLKSYKKPDTPEALRVIHREATLYILWDFPKSGENLLQGFVLMKSDESGAFKNVEIAYDKRSYLDTEFMVGSEYRYTIISKSHKGVTSRDSPAVTVRPAAVPPPPADITFRADLESVILQWSPSGEHIRYNVYRRKSGEEYGFMPVNATPLTVNSFRDSFDISRSVHYQIRSLAGHSAWDEGAPSAEINVDPKDFVPSAPQNLHAVNWDGGVQLIWREPPEPWITGYRVYRGTDKEQGYLLIGGTQTPAYFDREALQGKRTYRVSAVGPAKEGESAEVTVVTTGTRE